MALGTQAFDAAALQPYSSFDLSKIRMTTPSLSPTPTYGIPVPGDAAHGYQTQYKDVTAYINQLMNYSRTLAAKDQAGQSIYGSAGYVQQSPQGGQYNTPLQPDSRMGVSPWATSGANTVLQGKSAEFMTDRPGYFQVGEDPSNRGNYNGGVLDTNNIATDQQVAQSVIYDPKYGYIAPNQYFKRVRPDFYNKYGPYLVLAAAGIGLAASAIAGAGAASGTVAGTEAATVSGAEAVSSEGLLTQAAAPIVEGVPTSVAAGSTVAAGAPAPVAGSWLETLGTIGEVAGPVAAAAGPALGSGGGGGGGGGYDYSSGAGGLGNSSGGSQGIWTQAPAPVYDGVPSSTGPGDGGGNNGGGFDWLNALTGGVRGAGNGGGWQGALAGGLQGGLGGGTGGGGGGLGGNGGGGSGWLQALLGAGLTYAGAERLKPEDKYTDYSSIKGEHVSLDPSIRRLQDESLGNTRAMESGVMGYGTQFRNRSDDNLGEYNKIYAELTSNSNPFIQARVNPLREQIASRRGEMQRGQGLRGISGSSFGNDELTNFDFGANRQLGDATSTATQEALGARSSTLGNISALNSNTLQGNNSVTSQLGQLNNSRNNIAQQRSAQELAALGLSGEAAKQLQQSRLQQNDAYGKLFQGLFGG